MSEIRWTTDSRHWVAFTSDTSEHPFALIYDVNRPGMHSTSPIAVSGDTVYAYQGMGNMGNTQSLVAGNRILTGPWTGTDNVKLVVAIVEIGIDLPVEGLRTREITLPQPVIYDMQIAPSGRKVAWILVDRPLPRRRRLGVPKSTTIGPQGPGANIYTMGLWVSNIDGTQMHRLGYVTEPAGVGWFPMSLQWVPGEKLLSFDCDEALWTIPVD